MSVNRSHIKLVVSSRSLYATRWTRSALRKALPGARIRRTAFTAVFVVQAEDDALELARRVNQACSRSIGRATAVLAETESTLDPIKEAAVRIGAEQIGDDESFCVRLFKRRPHGLERDTPEIEYEIGKAIWLALRQKYGKRPKVALKNPDITVMAEVLGPRTAVGILRKAWREPERELATSP